MIHELVERELGADVTESAPVGGGSISRAYRCRLSVGRDVFVKTAPSGAPPGMMEQERLSLHRIAETDTVRVPEVLGAGADWLILEWLEPAKPEREQWEQLGRQLARMHRAQAGEYGWESDNFIGALRQSNRRHSVWPEFWRDERLVPQLEAAAPHFDRRTQARFERLLASLDERLGAADADGPSLVHGDLWNGNVQFTADRAAVLDPACSYGHREVDLAMAALFGGFPAEFLAGYEAEWPLLQGAEERRAIYQLYYLLVHVNLFGGGYVLQTHRLLDTLA